MATTIALLNMKGGVGKTTLAVNLAWHSYRHKSRRVLLVDLDPQFNASQYMMDFAAYKEHLEKKGTIADLLIDQPQLTLGKANKKAPQISNCIAEMQASAGGRYLHLLPSQLALAHVVKNPAQMEFRLEKILQTVKAKYDYIFIDCAPTDSVLTTMALTASNYVLIPIRPDRFSILGYGNLVDTIRTFKEKTSDPNDVKELGLIFTQVRGENAVEKQCMDEVQSLSTTYGSYVFPSTLRFSATFLRAIESQTPAFETKYARDDLKTSIADIVKDMEKRIISLEKATA